MGVGMGKSWREWKSSTLKLDKNGEVILRKRNRKDRRSWVAHCCKMHHDWDARAYDELRDLREGKKEDLKHIRNALRGCV